MTSPRVPAAAG